jgi:hypothetical protein
MFWERSRRIEGLEMTPSPECRNGRELLNFARGQSNPRDKIHPATLPDNESAALSAPEVCFNVLFVPSKDLPWDVSVEGGRTLP